MPGLTPDLNKYQRWTDIKSRILQGKEDLGQWSNEELRRCKRQINGQWYPSGKSPDIIPRPVLNELMRRAYSQAEQKLTDLILPAIGVLSDAMSEPDLVNATRLRAAETVLDRTGFGKREFVNVQVERTPFEQAAQVAVTWVDASDRNEEGNSKRAGISAAISNNGSPFENEEESAVELEDIIDAEIVEDDE